MSEEYHFFSLVISNYCLRFQKLFTSQPLILSQGKLSEQDTSRNWHIRKGIHAILLTMPVCMDMHRMPSMTGDFSEMV